MATTILTKYFDVVGGKERLDSDPMVARAGDAAVGAELGDGQGAEKSARAEFAVSARVQ